MTATTTSTTSTSASDLSSQLAQAAQSIISGATNSSMDVNSLVQALVTAKTAGQATSISNQLSSDNTELSAIGKIKSALSSLDDALSGFLDGSALAQMQATTSGSGITATTTKNAVAGNYSVSISQLATTSTAISGAITAPLSGDKLQIKVGATGSMTIDVAGNESLSSLASAINNASTNPGVTATVITSGTNQYLSLTSTQTGANTGISVTSLTAGTNAALYTSGGMTATDGVDASLSINNIPITSSTNTITNALTGVTLDISGVTGASATSPVTQNLSVSVNTAASATAINKFVTAYNSYVTTASGLSSFNSSSSTAGPLLGDAMTNGITNGLAALVSGGIKGGDGTVYSLSAIGLDLQPDGTISVDSTKLQTALNSNSSAVSAIFNQVNGIGAKLDTFMSSYTQTSGIIDQRTSMLNTDISNLQDQSTNLTNYQDTLTAQYNAKFSALNTLMSQMANNTQYLTQLFGGKDSAGTLASNK